MSTELPKLNARLDEVDSLLELAGEPSPGDEALEALAQARGEIAAMEPRRVIFVTRAKEKDPDKMIYGPKMVQRVLEFDARLQTASERAEALELALQPARQQAAETAAAAAAEAERAAAEAAERAREEREAAAERQRAEAAARDAEAEAQRQLEREAHERQKRGAAPTSSADGAAAASDVPMIAAMALGDALALLQEGCGDAELADALQAVELLCANVVAHPDDAKFRTIRMLNPHFQQTVARHKGGLELLGALGFVVQQALEEDALQLVLEEPSLEADIERWSAWYDGLKAARAELRDALEARGLRPLPAAVKGGGWDTGGDGGGDDLEGYAVLHGQSGGGR